MAIYSIYIYNRQGTCLYYHEWRPKKRPGTKGDPQLQAQARAEEQKLMFGLLYSLKQFTQSIAPKPSEGFNSFKTAQYKLHYLETLTGFRFVLLTDPAMPDAKDHLKNIYSQYFVECVEKNPLYKVGTPIKCVQFDTGLDKYVRALPNF